MLTMQDIKGHYSFTDSDAELLSSLRTLAEANKTRMASEFYDFLLGIPETAAFFSDEKVLQRQREIHQEWFVGLFSGIYDFIAQPKMQMYFSYPQLKDVAANALVVRASVEPMSLASSVRNAIWAVDKDQPVADIDTMDHIVSEAIARQRFSMLLLGIFAALALVLAAVGIYGVMSYSVAQRTHEIGIRMALGARRTDVLQMTVKQGLRLVSVGMLLGLVAAFLLTRVLASLLFGISATDPITFIGISLVLLAVAILASYVPALRATKVDPIIALRAQ